MSSSRLPQPDSSTLASITTQVIWVVQRLTYILLETSFEDWPSLPAAIWFRFTPVWANLQLLACLRALSRLRVQPDLSSCWSQFAACASSLLHLASSLWSSVRKAASNLLSPSHSGLFASSTDPRASQSALWMRLAFAWERLHRPLQMKQSEVESIDPKSFFP